MISRQAVRQVSCTEQLITATTTLLHPKSHATKKETQQNHLESFPSSLENTRLPMLYFECEMRIHVCAISKLRK